MITNQGLDHNHNLGQLTTTPYDFLQNKFNHDFQLQPVTPQQLEILESENLLDVQTLKVRVYNNQQSRTLPETNIDIYNAFAKDNFIYFYKDNDQLKQFLTLDLTLSYTKIKRNKTYLKESLIFQRQNTLYLIEFLEYSKYQKEIKQWIRQINPYVLRTEQLSSYSLLEKLGEGSQGKVFKITKSQKNSKTIQSSQRFHSKKFYAVKTLNADNLRDRFHISQFIQKINSMMKVRGCENILSIQKMFINNKFLNIFLEYQEGGTLCSLILQKKLTNQIFTEQQAKSISFQILMGLAHMQKNGIIHRDIKNSNILVHRKQDGNYDIKISDFGMASEMSEIKRKNDQILCGTPGFMAPETLRKQGFHYNNDIFSAGCVIYSILTGDFLFYADNFQAILKQNKNCDGKYIDSKLELIRDPIAKDLLQKMLVDNWTQRINADQALFHEWFSNYNHLYIESKNKSKQDAIVSTINSLNIDCARNFELKGNTKNATYNGQYKLTQNPTHNVNKPQQKILQNQSFNGKLNIRNEKLNHSKISQQGKDIKRSTYQFNGITKSVVLEYNNSNKNQSNTNIMNGKPSEERSVSSQHKKQVALPDHDIMANKEDLADANRKEPNIIRINILGDYDVNDADFPMSSIDDSDISIQSMNEFALNETSMNTINIPQSYRHFI